MNQKVGELGGKHATLAQASGYGPNILGRSHLPSNVTLFDLAISHLGTGHLIELNDALWPYTNMTLCGRVWEEEWRQAGRDLLLGMCKPCEKRAKRLTELDEWLEAEGGENAV